MATHDGAAVRLRETQPAPRASESPPPDALEAAKEAGLRYVSDRAPGITRKRAGNGFRYFAPTGASLREPLEVNRIEAIGIPPAWDNVWICPSARGHIQATGRDAKGRKQFRYHPRRRAVRDETKYARILDFASALPRIRAATDGHLRRAGLPREKVLAAVVRLLEGTLIRVGNEEYAQKNDSYGLTTLRDWHAEISGPRVRFHFRGKSGKESPRPGRGARG